MPTTRHRVNLTLTEEEERALKQLTDPNSVHHQVLVGKTHNLRRAVTESRPDAELIHQVLAIGLAQLDQEASAASYAAEAAERGEERSQATAALRRNMLAKAAQQEVG